MSETKIIPFPAREQEEELEIREMNREQLEACLAEVEEKIAELDKKEPRNMASEAYEDWATEHEDLEDIRDEILDRLEGLG